MTLTDPEVAALARQAVDLLAPDVSIEVEPRGDNDPYGFGVRSWTVWPMIDGHRAFGMGVDASMSPAQALGRMIDVLSEYSSESARFWGVAFPACLAGHVHPADVGVDGDQVQLRCPLTGEMVGRISPDV